jgi:putative effector of murein hydrolase
MPSTAARLVAFASIVLTGVCGAVIGYALLTLEEHSTAVAAVGALVGGIGSAIGAAVVATLALRAMAEWRVIEHSRND